MTHRHFGIASREALVAKQLPGPTRYAEHKRADNVIRFPAKHPPCHGVANSRVSRSELSIPVGPTFERHYVLQALIDCLLVVVGVTIVCAYAVGFGVGVHWLVVFIVGKFA